MAIKPKLPNIMNLQSVAGAVYTAVKPTPLGVALTAGNLISNATTGKTLTEHAIDAVKPDKTKTTTTDETDDKKDNDAVGVSYNPAQLGPKNMRAGRLAKGGLVSHKSVFDLE